MTEQSKQKAPAEQDATESQQQAEQQSMQDQPLQVNSEKPAEYKVTSKQDASDGLAQEAEDMLQFDQQDTPQASQRHQEPMTPPQPRATESSAPVKPGISKVALLALLIAIISAAACYWLFQQTLQRNDQISQLQATVNSRSDAYQQLQQQLAVQQANSEKAVAALTNQLAQQQKQQQVLQQNMQLIAGKSQNEWALAEADYLLQLAVKRLQFEQDVTTALALLLSADQALAAAADNDLLALRDSIAKDIGKLNALAQSDSNQILLAIETLIAMVPELPLAQLTAETMPTAIEPKTNDAEQDWLDKMLDTIKPFIRIQKNDRSLEPLLSPTEHQNLRNNMILALQQAQMATLRKQQQHYQQQFEKVTTWFKQYFQTSSEQSERFEKLLSEMAAKQVSSPIPKLLSPSIARSQLTTTLQTLLNNKAQQVQQQEQSE